MSPLQVLGSGQPKPVDARAIEEELSRLWQEAADASAEEGEPPVAQVRLFNLVAYAEDRAAADRAAAVMADLPARHPCRGIVVEAEPESPARPLEARITAYCHLPSEGGKQVCCECVTIAASGRAIEQLPGAVLPLLAPDLPYFLWWLGDPPFESQTFDDLADTADRLIVDSAEFRSPYKTLAWLADASSDRFQHPALGDLNWARLKPWREVAAQFFDAPARQPHLTRIQTLTIGCAAGEGGASNPSQPLLLASWLAARLGWQVDSCRPENGDLLVEMRSGGSPVTVRIGARPPQGQAAGDVVSLRLETGGAEPAVFSATRGEDGLCAETTAELSGGESQRRVARMDPLSDTELLCDELELAGRDPVYEDALRLVSQIAQCLESAGP